MSRFLPNFVLLSSALIFLASFAVYTSYQKPINKKYARPTEPPTKEKIVYKDKSGKPMYSYGACKANAGCAPAGCSSQICSNDPGLITTCEIKTDFPDKNVYRCGCLEEGCVWYK